MVVAFDQIKIAVADLSRACSELKVLTGKDARILPDATRRNRVAWLALANTTLELEECVENKEGQSTIDGLVLTREGDIDLNNSLGVSLSASDGAATAQFRADFPGSATNTIGVDHVVFRCNDGQACIDFFGSQLGIRLALDQNVPEWGGRMLFFRAGKLTLEVLANEETQINHFWGLTFFHPDLDAWHRQLLDAGAEVSAVRDGRKPGTRVASLKSHCLGLPVLLLQPAPRKG
jgi:catechol 2,3-dioxygenase-like lactoylglutathione lyase family enzyme